MQTKALFFTILTGLAMLTACGDKHAGTSVSDQETVSVQTVQAQYRSIPVHFEAPGTVQPRDRIALASQINGFVEEMKVNIGDRVKQGQILATLDPRDARSQKAAAESAIAEARAALSEATKAYQAATEMQAASKASLELAEQTYKRYENLFESKSVSPQEMDEVRARRDAGKAELAYRESMVAAAQARIKQVEARISQAEAQSGRADVLMSYTSIKAPNSGIIVERAVDTGTAIFPGTPLVVIETTDRPQVLVNFPTEQAGKLHIGLEVRLRLLETSPDVIGRVSEIVPQSNPASHSVQFKADLPSDVSVIHGQYVKAEVPIGTRDALLVDREDIRKSGQLEGVFVVEGGNTARFRLVKTDPYDADQVEILSGVEPGEDIITRPNNRIP